MVVRVLVGALIAVAVGGVLLPLTHVRAQSVPLVDAKIEVVWPHDKQGHYVAPDQAHLVNVEVDLFQRGTLNPVACDFPNLVLLHWAYDYAGGLFPTDEPLSDLISVDQVQGQRIMRTEDGKTFPTWVFNDVPVLPTYDGLGFYATTYFMVAVGDADYRTNVWANGSDPRPPVQALGLPTAISTVPPSVVDASIQIVWPHDAQGQIQPVSNAPLANVAVALFEPTLGADGQLISVSTDFPNHVHLLRSLNDGFLSPVAVSAQMQVIARPYGAATIRFPRWVFNNVDVSAAENSQNTYYFAAEVDGLATHTTIWAHGAHAYTYTPVQDVPASSCSG